METTVQARIMGLRIGQDYDREWMRERGIVRVWGVYVYDANRPVHCCELTPSYELLHVHDQAEYAPGIDDAARERADDEIMQSGEEGYRYMHVGTVDRLPESRTGNRSERWPIYDEGECAEWDMDHDEAMEKAREYCACNWQ